MFLLPVGVDGAAVRRVPWVSIAIACLCLGLFALTWIAPSRENEHIIELLDSVMAEWEEHPERELPPWFLAQLDASERREVERRHAEAKVVQAGPGSEQDLGEDAEAGEREREAFARRLDELERAQQRSVLRRLSLVPARGLAQLGWLTHMFIHYGWMHILGNLLFFYLVGPLLEDAWGRPLFALVYLVGGVFAAGAHAALDPSSGVMTAGASGAIAVCMGAFGLRLGGERIRMAYVFFIGVRLLRGTFAVPAWLWALAWFLSEVHSFAVTGGEGGVAVMAHLGGFGFGVAAAFALRVTGFEARYIAPALEKKTVAFSRHPGLAKADEALAQRDDVAAQQAYEEVLSASPQDEEANLGLARLELGTGRTAEAMRRVDALLTQLLSRSPDRVWPAVEALAGAWQVSALRPQLSYRVATAMERAPEGLMPLTVALYERGAEAGGITAPKALLRAAELCPEPARASELLRRLAAMPDLPAELKERFEKVKARVATEAPAPRIFGARLIAYTPRSLRVRLSDGDERTLAMTEVLGVAVGQIAGSGGRRDLLLTDLVLAWNQPGAPALIYRLSSAALGLTTFFPGVPPLEAYARFLSSIVAESGARLLTDTVRYQRFLGEDEFTRVAHGAGAVT